MFAPLRPLIGFSFQSVQLIVIVGLIESIDGMAMTLEQLRVFVAVAERQHMTRAAAALNMTQSTASAAIAALESRHGMALFDRVGRGLVLNEAGRTLLPYARDVLAAAALTDEALEDLTEMRRGHLRLSASQTVGSYWLPARMVNFASRYPAIETSLSIGNTTQVAAAVAAGEADLGVVEGPVASPNLTVTPLAGDRLALVAAAGHTLAGRRTIGAAELLEARWVVREKGSGTRREGETALKLLGIEPEDRDIGLELPSNEAVLAAVRASAMLAVLSELTVASALATGDVVRLPLAFAPRAFLLVTHSQRRQSRASAAFSAMLTAGD
jgi:DNA-binding transcriptional LysR family regulator